MTPEDADRWNAPVLVRDADQLLRNWRQGAGRGVVDTWNRVRMENGSILEFSGAGAFGIGTEIEIRPPGGDIDEIALTIARKHVDRPSTFWDYRPREILNAVTNAAISFR